MGILKTVGMVVAISVSSLVIACGDTSTVQTSDAVKGREEGAFQWAVIFTPTSRTVKIGSDVGYCVGNPRPRIVKPNVEYRGDEVYIRAELHKPSRRVPSRGPCRGVGLLVTRKIVLRRNLSEVELYDSGVDPPELRWP